MVEESLRGRTGGGDARGRHVVRFCKRPELGHQPESISGLMKYWYHFSIMFEALFILTTIDTGTPHRAFCCKEAANGLETVRRPAGCPARCCPPRS